ncbi:hypothetical protein LWI29_014060 [Acer saccharum]|uniref:Uncharacterized protein n=1 Tax=Acer saccharum TaxID=4024 RepID=A0AA39ST15_ACESA|nr:hypothetical protein LWI29_014060 [Acer saccharum]
MKVNLESISEKKLPKRAKMLVSSSQEPQQIIEDALPTKEEVIRKKLLQIMTKHMCSTMLNHTQTQKEHGFTVGKLQGNNLGLSEVIKKKEEEIEMIKTEIKKLILKGFDETEKEVGLQTDQSKLAEAAEVERALKASEDEAAKKVKGKQIVDGTE